MSSGDFGKACVFLSRGCGGFAAIIILVCGFVTLLPLPSLTSGIGLNGYGRCVAVGLMMIVTAVVMFFLEVSVLGYCVDKLAFLLAISKYMKNWVRAILYLALAFVPLVLWCLSISTLIGLGTMFLVGAVNFILAIGQKGEHQETYGRMRMSDFTKVEEGSEDSDDDDFNEKSPVTSESKI